MIADWLVSGRFEPVQARNLAAVTEEIRERPFDLLIADAALAFANGSPLVGMVRARNPRTPIVVIGAANAAHEAQAVTRNVTYLARPVERTWFECSISMALMESRPERRSPRKPLNRFEAIVDGAPSHIVDVSREGLRLEMPRSRKSPPPVFTVHLPMLGVLVCVRRMWTGSRPGQERDTAWYGAELSENSPRVERAWLAFVDAIPAVPVAIETA